MRKPGRVRGAFATDASIRSPPIDRTKTPRGCVEIRRAREEGENSTDSSSGFFSLGVRVKHRYAVKSRAKEKFRSRRPSFNAEERSRRRRRRFPRARVRVGISRHVTNERTNVGNANRFVQLVYLDREI